MSWHYKKDYHLPLLIKSHSSPVTSSMSPPLRLTILHRNENGFINSSTLFPLKSTYFWFNIMEWETYLLPAGQVPATAGNKVLHEGNHSVKPSPPFRGALLPFQFTNLFTVVPVPAALVVTLVGPLHPLADLQLLEAVLVHLSLG